MSFPTSPANGQIATVNGISYIYNQANNAWKRQALTTITATNITATNYFYSNSSSIFPSVYDLDEIYADGRTNTFYLRYNQSNVSVPHPWAITVTINGIFQPAFNANYDTVWLSETLSSQNGYTIDTDGNIKFADCPPAQTTIIVRNTGSASLAATKIYPFRPLDILMGI